MRAQVRNVCVLLAVLGGAVSAGVARGTPPSRPVLPRGTGVAPPTRIPDVPVTRPAPAGTPVATAAVPRAVRRAVVADAARRFDVASSAVVLADAERVIWSDAALGCVEPGVLVTQGLVPGFRLVAKTTAGVLTYHTDMHGQVRSCGPDARQQTSSPTAPPR